MKIDCCRWQNVAVDDYDHWESPEIKFPSSILPLLPPPRKRCCLHSSSDVSSNSCDSDQIGKVEHSRYESTDRRLWSSERRGKIWILNFYSTRVSQMWQIYLNNVNLWGQKSISLSNTFLVIMLDTWVSETIPTARKPAKSFLNFVVECLTYILYDHLEQPQVFEMIADNLVDQFII